jgi:recombination protein RecA
MRLGENKNMNVGSISTGSLTLDLALGIAGCQRGESLKFTGLSLGKTTIALHILASAQKRGARSPCWTPRHALDPGYAHALGVRYRHASYFAA